MGAFLKNVVQEHNDPVTMNDAQQIAESLKNEISMANDPTVEVDTERIIGRIDDLQNQLPKDVAEELSR